MCASSQAPNLQRHVTEADRSLQICGSSVWGMLCVPLLAPGNLSWLLRSLQNLWTLELGSHIIYRCLLIGFGSKVYVYSTGGLHVWYIDPPARQNGPGYCSRYNDSLRAGRSGDRIPVGARFYALVHTGTRAHPASYTMGTGSVPWVKRPGCGVNHPRHLRPWLKKE
jgi:hypothetical protein